MTAERLIRDNWPHFASMALVRRLASLDPVDLAAASYISLPLPFADVGRTLAGCAAAVADRRTGMNVDLVSASQAVGYALERLSDTELGVLDRALCPHYGPIFAVLVSAVVLERCRRTAAGPCRLPLEPDDQSK